MTIVLIILHILVCLFLIGVVLLQTGKRADLAGAFGGGGSQTAFGARGAATMLTKATTIGAVMFMVTSIGLSVMAGRKSGGGESVLPDSDPAAASESAPGSSGELPPLPVDDALPSSEESPEGTDDGASGTTEDAADPLNSPDPAEDAGDDAADPGDTPESE